MSEFDQFVIGFGKLIFAETPLIRQTVVRIAQHRVMEFMGDSIDDIVSNPVARNRVKGYYRVYCFVERHYEEIARQRQREGQVPNRL